MNLSKWFFANWSDVLNSIVEPYVIPYRNQTTSKCEGHVVEIGGGTGANLLFFDKAEKITLIEPDPYMRSILSKRIHNIKKPIDVLPNHGENIPLKSNSVDSVLCTLVLCMVDDVEKVISEAHRILKPGGKLYFYEHIKAKSKSGKIFQLLLDPFWKFATTGCHLRRNTLDVIKNSEFTNIKYNYFNLNVGIPFTIPNISGEAIKKKEKN